MTKDDIISTDPINDFHRWSDFELRAIHRFMDEYAISFGKWIQGCNYAPAIGDDGKWQNQLLGENDIITTGELHSQFIEQQTKDK
jgi:hypothetical protein